jgi:RHS repeat-associated protein
MTKNRSTTPSLALSSRALPSTSAMARLALIVLAVAVVGMLALIFGGARAQADTSFTVSISVDDTTPSGTTKPTLTATASDNLDATKYYLQIVDTDENDALIAQCSSGSSCSGQPTPQSAGAHSYVARIALWDGSDVQASSSPVTVTYGQVTWPLGSVVLSSTPRESRSPGSLTATTTMDLTTYELIITDETTGSVIAACAASPCTAYATSTVSGDHIYMATVASWDGSDVQAASAAVTVTIPSGMQAAWRTTLTTDSANPMTGTEVTLTATSNLDVGSTPYWLQIIDQDTGAVLETCTTSPCQVPVWPSVAGTRHFASRVARYRGDDVQATSSVLNVVTADPTAALQASATATAVGSSVVLSVSTTPATQSVGAFQIRIGESTPGSILVLRTCDVGTECHLSVSRSSIDDVTYQADLLDSSGSTVASDQVTVSYVPWQVGVTVDDPHPAGNAWATVLATANGDLAGTHQHFQIQNVTTGAVLATCNTGRTCSAPGLSQDEGTNSFQATVVGDSLDNQVAASGVIEADVTVDATAAITTTPVTPIDTDWSVDLEHSGLDSGWRDGEIATANHPVDGTGLAIQIIDSDSGSLLAQCTSGLSCASPYHAYSQSVQARVIAPGAAVSVATSRKVSGFGPNPDSGNPPVPTWSITLTTDTTHPAAGQHATLTATANAYVYDFEDAELQIFDASSNSIVAACADSSRCTAHISSAYAEDHRYYGRIAYFSYYKQGRDWKVGGTSPDLVISFDGAQAPQPASMAAAPPPDWTVDLVSGAGGLLTAHASRDVADASYTVQILDHTAGDTVLSSCSAGTVCSAHATTAATAGEHTYRATILAGSSIVTASSDLVANATAASPAGMPSTVNLATDKTQAPAGGAVVLTASTDTDLATSTSTLTIIDETTGQSLISCASGINCVTTVTADGSEHDFLATVNALTSNAVTVRPSAWTVALTTDTSVFRAGDPATLTATMNQDITHTGGLLSVYVFDQTTGQRIASCTADHPDSFVHDGSGTRCSVPAWFGAGEPHSYIAEVAASTWPDQISAAVGVRASSASATLARAAWSVSLTSNKSTISQDQPAPVDDTFRLTAIANQDVAGTGGSYATYLVDDTAGKIVWACLPSHPSEFAHTGTGSGCQEVYAGELLPIGSHQFTAYVAAAIPNYWPTTGEAWPYAGGTPGQLTDIQARSATITVSHLPAVVTSFTELAHDDGAVQLAYTVNQVPVIDNRSLRVFDYTAGTVVSGGDAEGTCVTMAWNGCQLFTLALPAGQPPHAYVVHILYNDPNTHQQSIEASSSALVIAGPPVPPQLSDTEYTGGSNPAEASCHACQGDPINTATGEFFQSATDLGLPGVGPGLLVARTYSSGVAAANGPFGFGWSFNYDSHLAFSGGDTGDPQPRTVTVTQDNGSTVPFVEDPSGGYQAPARVVATLHHDVASNTWTFTRRGNQIMKFDSAGRLITESDLNANQVQLTYDSSGQLATATGPGGRSISFGWTGDRITAVTDSANRAVGYSYDSDGNLAAVTAADGSVQHYGYRSDHRLTTQTSPRGGVTTNSYDSDGRVVSQTDPENRVTTFAYADQQTTTTLPDGSRTVEVYDNGKLLSQTKAAGTAQAATTSYTYDQAMNTLSITDPLGAVTTSTYDANGNRLSSTDPLNHTTTWTYNGLNEVTATTDPLGRHSAASYDPAGNRLTATDPAGHVTRLGYNTDGTVVTTTDPLGKVTSFSYDGSGNLTATTDPDARTTRTAYDLAGHPTSRTDAAGHATSYTVDAAGRVLTTTNPLGAVTRYAYDLDGNVTTVTDPMGRVTTKTYDSADELVTATDPLGKVTSFTYTPNGMPRTTTDPLGHAATLGYDLRGNKVSLTDALTRTVRYSYDLADRLTKTTQPSGATQQAGYDDAGRLTTTTDANGHLTTKTYDDAGQLTRVTDPDNRTTSYSYTIVGRVGTVEYPSGDTAVSSYDDAGHLIEYTDRDGNRTSYSYDDAGLLVEKASFGRTTRYSYDTAGRPSRTTQPDGTTQTRSYDAAAQLTGLAYSDPATHDVSYGYDSDGERTSMVDGTGTTTYQYDSAGRRTSTTNGAGRTIAYSYDNAGRLSDLTYPGDRDVSYSYDAANQITGVQDWKQAITSFQYDPDGHLVGQTNPNGTSSTTTYDPAGELTGTTVKAGATTLAGFTYGYDDAGQMVQDTDTGGVAHAYGYNTLGQLTTVTSSSGSGSYTQSYTTTAGGQLTTLLDGGPLTYDTAGQLTSSVSPDYYSSYSSRTFTYDANGARSSFTVPRVGRSPAITTTYRYTGDGQLADVTEPYVSTISYTVDGDSLRQSRTRSGTTRQWLWDTSTSLPRLLGDGSTSYVYGPGLTPIEQISDDDGTATTLHPDAHGSVRLITDSSGAVVGTSQYDPYGRRVQHSGTADSAMGYTGQWTDPSTGLLYLRARDYDPSTGQFLTVDPALDQTHQPYTYADNNPLTLTDPSGLSATDWLNHTLSSGAGGHAVSFLEGAANAITAGGGNHLVDALSSGASCTYKHDGWYLSGEITGTLAPAALTGGAAIYQELRVASELDILTTETRTTILGENMTDRVMPFADATGARTLGFGSTAEEWNAMTPAQRWKLNDGQLRARINEGDDFRYIGQDPDRDTAIRAQFDLTRSELLRLDDRGIAYETVDPSEVIKVLGRP